MTHRTFFSPLLSLLAAFFIVNVAVPIVPSANAATGSDFQPGTIINDSIFYNPSTMSPSQIQAFLNAKVPTCRAGYTCLKDYSQNTQSRAAEASLCNQYNGGVKSSSQIIYDVSVACGINPQVILVLLQKEQSLVTDTWPEDIQYRSATGYGCPDTAACDSEYYGFFNQVYNAARQYKVYAKNAASYNYRTGRNNTIQWHPNSACGASTFFIYSQATAGLYNYTPYRPNQAALNNLYGEGDGCSAYGNRNFWRLFTDWFGSTTGGVALIKSNSGTTIYAHYGGKKQGIPSVDVLNAWGLGKLPVSNLTDSEVAAIPERDTILTRLVRNPLQAGMLLVADNSGFFAAWPQMISAWGFNPIQASNISPELLTATTWSGNLSPYFSSPGISGVNLVDTAQYHEFSSWGNLQLWAGDTPNVISVSPEFRSHLAASTPIYTNDFNVGQSRYYIDKNKVYSLNNASSVAFASGKGIAVTQNTLNLFPASGALDQFITSESTGTVYLVDAYKRYGFPTASLFNSYAKPSQSQVVRLSQESFSRLVDGGVIQSRFVKDRASGATYYLNQGLKTLPAQFITSSLSVTLDQNTIATYGGSTSMNCGASNTFIRSNGNPAIYMLEDGIKRPIATEDDYIALNASGTACSLEQEDINLLPSGNVITPFVKVDLTTYLIDSGKRYTLPVGMAAAFGLTSPTTLLSSTLAQYTDGGDMTHELKIGNRYIYVDTNGQYYDTEDSRVAKLWALDTSREFSTSLANKMKRVGNLSRFASSTSASNGTIYLVDDGKFYPIPSHNSLLNAGYSGQPIPSINNSTLASRPGAVWHGYLATDTQGGLYLLNIDKKYPISASDVSKWSTTQTPTELSDIYLGLFSTEQNVQSSLKTSSNPTVYGMRGGTKHGFPSAQAFKDSGIQGTTVVRGNLLESIPNGESW